jgi:hypothetical protein
MPLYLAFPASVKLGMVQVLETMPELLEELDEELLELEDELEDELLEEPEDELELELDELEELELDELELGAGGSLQAIKADERTRGAAQRLQGGSVIFMFITNVVD